MKYEKPLTEIILFDNEDIITTSGEFSSKPGNGWGDKNHNHDGPPGQNKK